MLPVIHEHRNYQHELSDIVKTGIKCQTHIQTSSVVIPVIATEDVSPEEGAQVKNGTRARLAWQNRISTIIFPS